MITKPTVPKGGRGETDKSSLGGGQKQFVPQRCCYDSEPNTAVENTRNTKQTNHHATSPRQPSVKYRAYPSNWGSDKRFQMCTTEQTRGRTHLYERADNVRRGLLRNLLQQVQRQAVQEGLRHHHRHRPQAGRRALAHHHALVRQLLEHDGHDALVLRKEGKRIGLSYSCMYRCWRWLLKNLPHIL